MSKQTKTTAEPVTYHDSGEAVTIRISGKAYSNLYRIADAMNRVSWCDNDNTPTALLENFIVGYDLLDKLSRPTEKSGYLVCGGVGEIAEDIISAIDTGFDDEGSPEAKKRIDELRLAFETAGLYA